MKKHNPVTWRVEIPPLPERSVDLRELYAQDLRPLVQVLWSIRHENWRDRWVRSPARVH